MIGLAALQKRLPGRSSGGSSQLQQVTTRLAGLTVALLLVMIIALEFVVYAITAQALQQSLKDTLVQRASMADGTVCHIFHLYCPQFGPPVGPGGQPGGGHPGNGQGNGPGGGPGNFGGNPPGPQNGAPFGNLDQTPSDASTVFVNTHLSIVHHDGALGANLLAPSEARLALQTRRAHCCVEKLYKGQTYLIYTRPLIVSNQVRGAVQASISENQYQSTLHSLLKSLVVVALLGLLISAGITIVLVRRSMLPIRTSIQRQRDFVADAAHELRTPLAIMRTVGEVGMGAQSVDDMQATVAQMLHENQHLTRLVEDLSLLARTDTDTVPLDRHPVDLSSLVADTADELSYLAEEQGVTVRSEVQSGVQVVGDLLRLRQLLLILLDNALKHTPEGGTVSVRLSNHHNRVMLQVSDSGPGIAPSDLPRIFDRFYRADKARTGEGSGLGLAIGKWIVQAHGGQIQAGNGAPRGAVFTVTLPGGRSPLPA